jgi:alkylhydroperoxidase family enzyme
MPGMGRIRKLGRDEVTPEIAEIFDKYLGERGHIPNCFRTWAQMPTYLSTLIAHYRAVMFTGSIPFKSKELLLVRVSQINECRY